MIPHGVVRVKDREPHCIQQDSSYTVVEKVVQKVFSPWKEFGNVRKIALHQLLHSRKEIRMIPVADRVWMFAVTVHDNRDICGGTAGVVNKCIKKDILRLFLFLRKPQVLFQQESSAVGFGPDRCVAYRMEAGVCQSARGAGGARDTIGL